MCSHKHTLQNLRACLKHVTNLSTLSPGTIPVDTPYRKEEREGGIEGRREGRRERERKGEGGGREGRK